MQCYERPEDVPHDRLAAHPAHEASSDHLLTSVIRRSSTPSCSCELTGAYVLEIWKCQLQAHNTRHTSTQELTAHYLPFVDVVVVSPSVAGWEDRRSRLRKQFPRNMLLAPNNSTAILKFVIGNFSNTESANAIPSEQNTHSDILIFPECVDSDHELNVLTNWNLNAGPSSTTCKVMRSIAWAIHTFDFRFLFRLGDDSYLRIDKFLHMLVHNNLPAGKAVIGQVLETLILGMIQQYPQGMGYALTYPVCEFIANASPWLLDTAPEDGAMARWLFAIGASFVNSTAWRNMDDGLPCDEDVVLVHKLPDDAWTAIAPNGLLTCST